MLRSPVGNRLLDEGSVGHAVIVIENRLSNFRAPNQRTQLGEMVVGDRADQDVAVAGRETVPRNNKGMPVTFSFRDFAVVMCGEVCRQRIYPAVEQGDVSELVWPAEAAHTYRGYCGRGGIDGGFVLENRCAGGKGAATLLSIRVGDTCQRLD